MEVKLLPFDEFRFELKEKKEIKVFVIEGTCEILGQEITNERWYTLIGMKSFLYTTKGCKFKVEGDCNFCYTSSNSNIQHIYSLFYEIQKGKSNVLIVGKSRSTLCSIFVNLFARIREKLLFTELDPKTGNILFPGVIGSVLVDKVVEYQRGYEMAACLGYFYGDVNISDTARYFEILNRIKEKINNIRNVVLGSNDLETVLKVVEIYEINHLIVVGDERLFNRVKVAIPGNGDKEINVEVTNLAISSGYFENRAISEKIHSYFYGRHNELTPYSLNLRDQRIFSKKDEMLAPASALPLGSTRRIKSTKYEEIEFEENYIMAAIDCEDEDEVLISPAIAFFLGVEKDSLRVLSPQSRLPKDKIFFRGEIKYYEN